MERRVADTDDGYTRIANELLEAVMSADLTARQLKIVLAVIRKTYGFGKKLDRITNTQIAAITGIHHTHVCTAKNEMIGMNILISNGNQIGVNKVVSDWNMDISQVSKTLANSANKSLAEVANDHSPTQLNTKETIQKKKEITPLPPSGVSDGSKKSSARKITPYQEVIDAYNEAAGEKLPAAEALNEKRKRGIKRLLGELKEPTVEAAGNYFHAFMSTAKPFYFGDNQSGWRANFDYLLRSETLTKTREGSL
ncbi:replication of DNA [Pantoea sp. 3_1284]|nr:replication of DNA [Pantoea sp. 3_1284]